MVDSEETVILDSWAAQELLGGGGLLMEKGIKKVANDEKLQNESLGVPQRIILHLMRKYWDHGP